MRDRRPADDGGFTLVEVIVAMGLLAVVSSAVLAMTVTGLRAAGTAKFASQAKGVIQARIESMRTMPYHVGRSAGEYVDVLDTYFTDVGGPATVPVCRTASTYAKPETSWNGYVSATATRCAYEPAGPFYRKVDTVAAPGMGAFTVVTDTQYLSLDTPPTPVAPPFDYDRRSATADTPASQQIGVTVTVLYKAAQARKATSSYTQIAARLPAVPVVISEASTQALRVSGAVAGEPVLLTAGTVTNKGAVYTGSTVFAQANAASASSGNGATANGATLARSAPADITTGLTGNAGAGKLNNTCDYACFGPSNVRDLAVVTTGPPGQPGVLKAGTPALPINAFLPANGASPVGFFTKNVRGDLGLLAAEPVVTFDQNDSSAFSAWAGCASVDGGPDAHAYATGYLDSSTSFGSRITAACATAQTRTVALFRTSWAPDGIVQVRLNYASAYCNTTVLNGVPAATATVSYDADVRYWNGSGYTSAGNVSHTNATDPLAAVPLGTSVGGGKRLGDYVSSWASLAGASTSGGNTNRAKASVAGVVRIDSQPMLAPSGALDPSSVVSIQVGALACEATDLR
jgi:prepilin-type N-terminal cleavage/methylation domain-containing protein